MLDPDEFRTRFQHFKKVDYGTYLYCFGEFWKWKLKTECGNGQILSTSHLEKTYAKLSQTLKIWQWHRPCIFSELAPSARAIWIKLYPNQPQPLAVTPRNDCNCFLCVASLAEQLILIFGDVVDMLVSTSLIAVA